MRAVAVFPRRRLIQLVDHPAPNLTGPSDVLANVLAVGVCGTDRDIARFDYGIPPDGDEYLVIGHQSLAQVVDVGDSVDGLAPGDLVVTMVRRACRHPECRPCRAGRQDFCVTGDYTERGIKGRHGFMTEQLVDDARYMVRVPWELGAVAVLTEPLTIAQKALEELWRAQDRLPWIDADAAPDARGRGHKALVLGAGPVGLLAAMALLAAGFETTVYSRSPAPNPKADLAEHRDFFVDALLDEHAGARTRCPAPVQIHAVHDALYGLVERRVSEPGRGSGCGLPRARPRERLRRNHGALARARLRAAPW
jgi:glucose 1-dehydrogenase